MEKLERTKWMTQSLVIMFSRKFFYFEQDNQRKEYNELNMLEKKMHEQWRWVRKRSWKATKRNIEKQKGMKTSAKSH